MGFQISGLPAIPSCQLTDLIAEVQPATGGTTYKATLQQVADLIASVPSLFPYTDVTGTSQLMSSNHGYIANNGATVTLTLPVTSAVGDRIEICGAPASGGWSVAQNGGQFIEIGNVASTVGVTGSVESSSASDSMVIICTVANTAWTVLGGPQSSILTIN